MQTRERCQRLCSLLQRVLPLVREHPVDFFVSNLWEVAVPADWRAELCEMSVQELAMLGGTAGVRAGSYDDSIAAERSNEAELRARNTTTDAETSHADQEGSLAAFLRELHEATVARALTETKEPAETSSSSASSLLYTSSLHSASPSESKKPPQSGSNYRALSVSDKKAHEVPRMAEEVQRLAARHAVSCVVDLGSGKGYLAEELARRGVKVVGIDCNPDNARGAERRHRLLVNPKLLHAGRSKTERAEAKRIQNDGRPPFSPPLDDPAGDGGGDDGDAPRGEAYSRGELPFHMITGRVEGKDSAALGRFLEERTLGAVTASERLMLVGLHACGDLTATLLRCFVACDNVRSVMVVGCCYHRLTETRACSTPAFESASPPPAPLPAPPYPPSGMVNDVSDVALADDEEGPTREREDESAAASWEVERDGVREAPATRDECVGFPMSRWVRDRLPSWLGKSALTLAGHSTVDRIAAGRGTDSLYHATFCRAVFQVLWHETIMPALQALDTSTLVKPNVNLHLRANKFSCFLDYVRAGMKKLGVDHSMLADAEIIATHDQCYKRIEQLRRYVALRRALAPCIESILLLDRVCFLEEGGVNNVSLVPIFDPLISPRCVAISASR